MKSVRQSNFPANAADKAKVMIVNEEIPSHYGSYLQQIQQRNIRLRQLQRKDVKQIEKEKREEGFSLYFQGANKQGSTSQAPCRLSARARSTANHSVLDKRQLTAPQLKPTEIFLRSKTAPDKTDHRKEWNTAAPVSILTERGSFVSAKPPDLYSEDFEKDDEPTKATNSSLKEKMSSSIQVILNKEDIHQLRQSLFNSMHLSQISEDIIPHVVPSDSDILPEVSEDIHEEDEAKLSDGNVVLEFEGDSEPLDVIAEKKLDYILSKIHSLSSEQHNKLLNILTDLDENSVEETPKERYSLFTLYLITNWGHPNRIGLTEVDFFDKTGSKVHVKGVKVRKNHKDISEDQNPNVLINDKTKTSNDRSMWSCDFQSGETIQLLFDLGDTPESSVQRIELWNYNKSMKDLNVGTRNFRLSKGLDNVIIHEGELEKGLGNQAFARCTVVDLTSIKSQVANEQMNRVYPENVSDGEVPQEKVKQMEDCPCVTESRKSSFDEYCSSSCSIESGDSLRMESRSNFSRENDEMEEIGHLSLLDQVRVINKSQKKMRSDDKDSDHPTWYEELQNTPRKFTTPRINDGENIFDRESPMQKIQSARAKRSSELPKASVEKCVMKNAKQLEDSWSSLNFFNRSHAGRISMELHGDALDSCLKRLKGKEPKSKDENSHISTKPKSSPRGLPKAFEDLPIKEESDSGWSDEEFFIPELPFGRHLTVNILTTWGDKYYVGMTGVEVFDNNGDHVKIVDISSNPSDINILPGYGSDPRVVQNLIDGVNKTKDDVHMWLTPFTPGQSHFIYLTFQEPRYVAMVRFWNYNKSRVHYTRGARYLEMSLDEQYIFKGEISKAIDVEETGETILFTTDDEILEKISQNDVLFVETSHVEEELLNTVRRNLEERPPTADASSPDTKVVDNESRPFTSVNVNVDDLTGCKITSSAVLSNGLVNCRVLQLNFIETWSDTHYIGLTGIVLLDAQENPIDPTIGKFTIESNPKDVTILPGFEKDCRVINNLLDEENVTVDDEHMWLTPYTPGGDHFVKITLGGGPRVVSGIRIWNYNKSPEDTYRGAKYVLISADDQPIPNPDDPDNLYSGAYLLRRGVGHNYFDFGQNIYFKHSNQVQKEKPFQVSRLPQGFIFQLNLYSAWYDNYYIGLNGVELFDHLGQNIVIQSHQVAAWPESVNVLSNQQAQQQYDVRTPDKLVDGENDTQDPHHMWLAPILPGHINRIYLIFDTPVTVSMMKLWNYSKTPARGVKDFALLVDDLLIHSSCLPIYSPESGSKIGGIVPSCRPPQQHHTILFDHTNVKLLSRERPFLLEDEIGGDGDQLKKRVSGQDVRLTNDREIVVQMKQSSSQPVDQNLRPKTSVQSNRRVALPSRR